MADYPDCPPLGSDAAELQAFAASLALVKQLVDGGHSELCAQQQAYMKQGCLCGVGPGGRDG